MRSLPSLELLGSFMGLLVTPLLFATPALARDFHVDPATGSPSNDGSEASPWRTLEEVVDGGALTDGTVAPGDRVLLHDGYHGELSISGGGQDAAIVIEAAPDATPRLRRVLLRNTRGWTIRGLTISPSFADTYEAVTMIDLDGAGTTGVLVESNTLYSEDEVSGWAGADWVDRASSGISVDGPDNQIVGNHLRNVRFGISVSGARVLVARNVIESFSADGLRGLGDYDVFEGNFVVAAYADDSIDANHDDGFQSWSVGEGGVGTGEVVGVVLRGNTIVNYTDPDQPFRATLQGIGCFDGFFTDWVIENNVVVTDHWHGITLLGARGAHIVNNTVIDLNTERPGPPWIQIGDHKDGTPSEDCVVRNNLVTDLDVAEGTGMVEDHNLVITDPSAYLVAPEALDFRLLAGVDAIDVGSTELAPAFDHDGVARPFGAAIDLGAYEWIPPGTDAGVARDGAVGPIDAGPWRDASATRTDGGADAPASGGCGCRAAGAPGGSLATGAAALLLGVVARARRRARG